MTRELSGGDTKSVQESEYEDETEVDEVEGKVIKRKKSYNISFLIGFIISHKCIH